MEPRCSHCGSPKFLRHPEGWKGCGKAVLAGLVCVWCGYVERGVYAIGWSTREDYEQQNVFSFQDCEPFGKGVEAEG